MEVARRRKGTRQHGRGPGRSEKEASRTFCCKWGLEGEKGMSKSQFNLFVFHNAKLSVTAKLHKAALRTGTLLPIL